MPGISARTRGIIQSMKMSAASHGCSKVCALHAGVYEALLLFVVDTQPYGGAVCVVVVLSQALPSQDTSPSPSFPKGFVQMMTAPDAGWLAGWLPTNVDLKHLSRS